MAQRVAATGRVGRGVSSCCRPRVARARTLGAVCGARTLGAVCGARTAHGAVYGARTAHGAVCVPGMTDFVPLRIRASWPDPGSIRACAVPRSDVLL